jgi:molybdopterin converting factor subunit 1
MSAPIRVLYFAWLRERVGVAREEIPLPEGVGTVGALVDHLSARDARHEAAFRDRRTVRCAVNQEFAELSDAVRPGDEVGFFPPVTGG